MKALWASVQGDPVFMRRVNGWLLVFFMFWTGFCLVVPIGKYLAEQTAYVSFISHVALVLALLGSWQAARVEVKQDEQAKS